MDLRPAYEVIGLGGTCPTLWLAVDSEIKRPAKETIHLAFTAKNRQQVRDFHACAL